MKAWLLIVFLFISHIAFAQGRIESYEQKVQSLMAEKKYTEVKTLCQEWKEKNPEETAKIQNYLLDASKKEYEETTKTYNDFVASSETAPSSEEEFVQQGIDYDEAGNPDEAIILYNKALELNSNYADAYNNRGISYDKKGDPDQAILDYTKAIKLDPQYADAYMNRAVAYYQKQDYTKAWDDVDKAESLGADIAPDFLEALRLSSGREE